MSKQEKKIILCDENGKPVGETKISLDEFLKACAESSGGGLLRAFRQYNEDFLEDVFPGIDWSEDVYVLIDGDEEPMDINDFLENSLEIDWRISVRCDDYSGPEVKGTAESY